MRKLTFFFIVSLFLSFTSIGVLYAQMPVKKSSAQVTITYPGDTDKTIARRMQWIEGAKKEGTVVWWGTIATTYTYKIIAEFNKIYPFIKVEYLRATGEQIAAKIEAEQLGGKTSADFILGGEPANYPRWRKMGVLEKFTDFIPGFKNLDKRSYSKYGDWAISGENAVTPQYNTKLVSAAEAPKTWEDLLDPKWKGHIGITTDMKVWTTLALEEGGWGIEKTEDFLKKLKEQRLVWGQGHAATRNLLFAGEIRINGEDYTYHIVESKKKGAPVEWCRVQPVPIVSSAFTLQKMAPHPHAARLFLEWQFSPQGLIAFEAITDKGSASPASGTRMAKELAGLPVVYQTEEGIVRVIEMGLDKKFGIILGVTPE